MTPVSFNNAFSGGAYSAELVNLRRQFAAGQGKGIEGTELNEIPLPLRPDSATSNTAAVGFDNVLGKLVKEVNAKQMAVGDAVTGLLSGQNVPLHQAMIAMEEASVSFQLMVEVRNKLLEGYQELIRMQV
ncbi:MAG: flagellar hook-basal body complex protein FliE [Verrucomicrobia bacterium]|nr:flagellar hook-basal body complex protein FliE [Verrucomicrobiota bacterium]